MPFSCLNWRISPSNFWPDLNARGLAIGAVGHHVVHADAGVDEVSGNVTSKSGE